MTTPPPNPHDPKSAEKDEAQHPSRKSQGPNNPLPGEPGGPSTAGHAEPSDEKARDKDRDDHGKR